MGCGELLGYGHIFLFEILNALQTNKLPHRAHLEVILLHRHLAWHKPAPCMFKSRFWSEGGVAKFRFSRLFIS